MGARTGGWSSRSMTQSTLDGLGRARAWSTANDPSRGTTRAGGRSGRASRSRARSRRRTARERKRGRERVDEGRERALAGADFYRRREGGEEPGRGESGGHQWPLMAAITWSE